MVLRKFTCASLKQFSKIRNILRHVEQWQSYIIDTKRLNHFNRLKRSLENNLKSSTEGGRGTKK